MRDGEKILRVELVEVVLVQHNLVDNQYQQKSEVLYTFTPNKSFVYCGTCNTEFDGIIIKFMDQDGRPLEEGKVNLTLLINK